MTRDARSLRVVRFSIRKVDAQGFPARRRPRDDRHPRDAGAPPARRAVRRPCGRRRDDGLPADAVWRARPPLFAFLRARLADQDAVLRREFDAWATNPVEPDRRLAAGAGPPRARGMWRTRRGRLSACASPAASRSR
jgi:hypothetical protein